MACHGVYLNPMTKETAKSTKKSSSGPTKDSTKDSTRTAIAIMAAGKGTRLKSKHPKVLHEVGGKPLLAHVIAAAKEVVTAADIYAIVGHEAESVRQAVQNTGVQFVVQEPQRGTGHALMSAGKALAAYDQVIVPLKTPPATAASFTTERRVMTFRPSLKKSPARPRSARFAKLTPASTHFPSSRYLPTSSV